MDAMVTARVPAEIREAGVEALREIGSSPTELINAAFGYVIRNRKLPSCEGEAQLAPGRRTPTPDILAEVENFASKIRIAAPPDWEGKPFEELLDDAMGARYADLR